MENLKNLYELRKTLRFNLKPQELKRPYNPIKNDNNDIGNKINTFIEKYKSAIEKFEQLVFFTLKDNKEKKLKENFIKHSWLRNYTKKEFYDVKNLLIKYDKEGRKRGNKVSAADLNVSFLKDYFEQWIVENRECVETLQSYLASSAENQKRISEYAYWAQRIAKRSNFEFIFELFNGNIEHKNNNNDIDAIKKLLDECKPLLVDLEKELLPSQSFGVKIERASLNYYTVNKMPKNYSQEIQNKKSELQQKYSFLQNEQNLFNQVGFTDENLPIIELKEMMKQFKAKQKFKFYEFCNQKKKYQELKKFDLKLLDDVNEENFNKFCKKNDKQEKGKFFQFAKNNFPQYFQFCNLYKNVAVKFGEIKVKIKALEKEKVDAERLQSWAVILEKDNQKYILTIPRDANNNLSSAKKYIDGLQYASGGLWKLYAFESLTLRALDKLCFGFDKNTFYLAIKDELKQKEGSFFSGEGLKRKDQFSDDGKELIRFYQAVLGLDSIKKMLAINNFEGLAEIIQKDYQNKENFEKDLKQSCYYKKLISITDETKNKIINDFQGNLYKITSYDLEKEDKEEIAKLENKTGFDRNNPEAHTKIWFNFWTDENFKKNYETRLNPEFKISFVENKANELNDEKLGKLRKNRKLADSYLLSTTITLQAHEKNVDLSFKKTEEIKSFIDGYNKNFNQKIKPFDIYYYGLDRGQKELLTLGIFKFSENEKVSFQKFDGTSGEYNKPEFVDLEIYIIKKDQYLTKNQEGRIAYKSSNQFIDDQNVAKRMFVKSCLDLSCAKLIKDKIVINGDVATYLELKRVSALRKIYEGAAKKRFTSDKICFNADKGCLFLNIENRGKTENENLYFYDERFSNILSLELIRIELQTYLDVVKNSKNFEIITIDKINNLRDALCANAIGILNYLQKKYFGVMVFENLNIDNKNKRISEFFGNLASRIEWKILQKFQALSLIPLQYRQAMTLQSKKEIDQLGVVFYSKTEGTSSQCPHCEVKNTDKTEKWNAHAYKCDNCNFDTVQESNRKGLVAIDNSDDVAAYNIAKRGLKLLQAKQKTETIS